MASDIKIVVTGMGAVTPFGSGISAFWEGVLAGSSAVAPVTDERLRQWVPVVAEARTFLPQEHLSKKLIMDTDRFTQLALVAAEEAMLDAGFILVGEHTLPPYVAEDRVGISLGSAFGGVQSMEAGTVKLMSSNRVSPRLVSKSIPNAAAATLAMRYHIRGPVMTYATACASSANAIGEASYWLKSGIVDMVLVGGAECLFTPSILAGLRAAGALALSGPEDYSTWSRPFDQHRQGMVMGEGSAVLILEEMQHAKARGAKIYAELTGYGASNDAYHETAPHPQGTGAALAMIQAIKSANLRPNEIEYINAHATATPAGDTAESLALQHVFTESLADIPVSSIKGAIGHLLGTAGAIESIACILALVEGILPQTVNCDMPDPVAPPCLLRNTPLQKQVTHILSNSFGFGGQNGALIWSRYAI